LNPKLNYIIAFIITVLWIFLSAFYFFSAWIHLLLILALVIIIYTIFKSDTE